MPLLHIKLNGPRTRINIPSTIRRGRFKLKSYRILFNRDDHGYYHGALNCTVFNNGNIMNFVKKDDPNYFAYDIPLFIDPEKKLTHTENCDWDLGEVQNVSSMIEFNLQLYNCIERKRYPYAYFDSTDPAIRGLYGKATMYNSGVELDAQPYFGMNIPMYLVPYSSLTSSTESDEIVGTTETVTTLSGTITNNLSATANVSITATPDTTTHYTEYKNPLQENWTSTTLYNADGTVKATAATPIYPDATKYVHTGVHVGTVDPRPGQKDFDARSIDATEEKLVFNSNSAIKGSGFRKGAIIYAYTIDLVFEIL
jgi:hypothetical protein